MEGCGRSLKKNSGEKSAHVGDGTESYREVNRNKKESANSSKQTKDHKDGGGDTQEGKNNGNNKRRICVEAKKDNKTRKEDEKEKNNEQGGRSVGSNKRRCRICRLSVTKGWSYDRHIKTQHGVEKKKKIKKECGDKGKYKMKIF